MDNLVWHTELRKLKDLKPYAKNPRTLSKSAFEKLKRSIVEDGYRTRLLVDADNVIIGGHGRQKALQDLGITEVEVLVPNRPLTPEEFDRINIRDNLPFGDFDMDILANNFTLEQLEDWGMEDLPKPELGEPQEPKEEESEKGFGVIIHASSEEAMNTLMEELQEYGYTPLPTTVSIRQK